MNLMFLSIVHSLLKKYEFMSQVMGFQRNAFKISQYVLDMS